MLYSDFKKRVYQIVEKASERDKLSFVFDIFIFTLIIFNILFFMLETVDYLNARFSRHFRIFEIVSVIIFSLEYLIRLWTITSNKKYCRPVSGRIKYIFSFMAIVDLLAILPFYLPMLFMLDARFLRILRLFRIARLFKASRYSDSFTSIARVLKKKYKDLSITVFVVFILLILSSSIMYYTERDIQPEKFSSIFASFWWGIITLTTVGYGDTIPFTILGKIMGGMISILGIGLVALPSGILASAFQEDLNERKEGRIQNYDFSNHIILCGYNLTTELVITKILLDEFFDKEIVLVSQKENPFIDRVLYVKGDFSNINILKNVYISDCHMCIIFSEQLESDTIETADMRNIFTVYNIKNENKMIHTIVELNNFKRIDLIKDMLSSDEIILKETLDSRLIAASITHLRTFPILYETINFKGKIIRGMNVSDISETDSSIPYRAVLEYGIENDITFIGFISKLKKKPLLSPSKDEIVGVNDTLIYVG